MNAIDLFKQQMGFKLLEEKRKADEVANRNKSMERNYRSGHGYFERKRLTEKRKP